MGTSCRLHVASFNILSGWCAMPKVRLWLSVPVTVPFLCPQRTQKLLARKQQSMTHQHYKSDPHVYLEALALSVKKLFEKLGMVGKRFGSLPYTSMCENAQNLKRQLNYSSWFLEFCFSG